MKKLFLTLGLVAIFGLSAASCSTDDSGLNDTNANDITIDNGDRDLPKPPMKP